jgi:hypothetical protein
MDTQANIQFLGKWKEDKNYLTQPNVTSVEVVFFLKSMLRELVRLAQNKGRNNEKS